MCFLAVLLEVVAEYPVAVAANRDEFYDRCGTDPGPIAPGVVAGCDPRAGGTWLGVNAAGALVAVANVHSDAPPRAGARSRGLLCLDLLKAGGVAGLADLLRRHVAAETYHDFNLLAADRHVAWIATLAGGVLRIADLAAGIHVFGNHPPDFPDDPKVARGRSLIERPDFGGLSRAVAIERAIANLSAVCRDHGGGRQSQSAAIGGPVRPDRGDAICVHGQSAGTLSSSLIALHESGVRRSLYLHAPGPPCCTPYRDVSALLAHI